MRDVTWPQPRIFCGLSPFWSQHQAESNFPFRKSLTGKIEVQSRSRFYRDPALSRHRRLHLEACWTPGAGAWLTATPASLDTHVSSWLRNAASACPYGTTTRRVPCVGKFWTGGVTTPFPAAVVATETTAITLRAPLSMVAPGSELDPGLNPSLPANCRRRLADIWVPRGVSGFVEAWDFSVSSLRRTSHESSAGPSFADVFQEVEATSAFSTTVCPRRPREEPPSACQFWKRAVDGGPRPCGRSLHGSLPSRAPRVASPWAGLGILASELHSASAAPFAGKTCVQSLRCP